jgi:hypothetical protein
MPPVPSIGAKKRVVATKRSVGAKKKRVGEQGVHGAAAWQQYGSHLRVGSDALQLCCRRAVALLY